MPGQTKKYRVILKPRFRDGESPDELIRDEKENIEHYQQSMALPEYADDKGAQEYFRNEIENSKLRIAELHREAPQNRVIDADFVKQYDATIWLGINPGKGRTSHHNFRTGYLRKVKNAPDFYEFGGRTALGDNNRNDPSSFDYILHRKFETILTVNPDNVISINDKPVISGMRNINIGGLAQFDEWSIGKISDLLED